MLTRVCRVGTLTSFASIAVAIAACGGRTGAEQFAQRRSNATGGTFATTTNSATSVGTGGMPPTNAIPPDAIGGAPVPTSCPDETTFQLIPTPRAATLAGHQDRFTPSCRAASGTPDYALGWFVGETDTYIFDTLGSEADTVLAVYSALCGNFEFACNDDDVNTSKQSRIALKLSANQFVTIAVDGWQGATGTFQLHVSRATSLINYYMNAGLPLNTRASTKGLADHTTSTCNDRKSSPDYTFLFEAPANGTYQFTANSSEFDPVLTLHDESVAGREIACNDNVDGTNAAVTYAFEAGAQVAITVDGREGSSGNFKFSAYQDPSDAGSCCSASEVRVGCIDPEITRCVCEKRASCCREVWDATCAGMVDVQGCGICDDQMVP